MTFSVEKDEGIADIGISCEEIFERVARGTLIYTGCPYECEVTLTLTDDEGIRLMNKEYRGMDRATDVLSFPLLEFNEPADFGRVEEEYSDSFNPDTGELMLGDILISTDHVIAQAASYGNSAEREFAFLIAHSMLHLQGFDHEEPEEAAAMEKAQEDILDGLGIRRQS